MQLLLISGFQTAYVISAVTGIVKKLRKYYFYAEEWLWDLLISMNPYFKISLLASERMLMLFIYTFDISCFHTSADVEGYH